MKAVLFTKKIKKGRKYTMKTIQELYDEVMGSDEL